MPKYGGETWLLLLLVSVVLFHCPEKVTTFSALWHPST